MIWWPYQQEKGYVGARDREAGRKRSHGFVFFSTFGTLPLPIGRRSCVSLPAFSHEAFRVRDSQDSLAMESKHADMSAKFSYVRRFVDRVILIQWKREAFCWIFWCLLRWLMKSEQRRGGIVLCGFMAREASLHFVSHTRVGRTFGKSITLRLGETGKIQFLLYTLLLSLG
jgi:hypothetical protein